MTVAGTGVCWSRARGRPPGTRQQKLFKEFSQIQGHWTEKNREIPEIFHVQADISFESF